MSRRFITNYNEMSRIIDEISNNLEKKTPGKKDRRVIKTTSAHCIRCKRRVGHLLILYHYANEESFRRVYFPIEEDKSEKHIGLSGYPFCCLMNLSQPMIHNVYDAQGFAMLMANADHPIKSSVYVKHSASLGITSSSAYIYDDKMLHTMLTPAAWAE